MTLIKPKLLLAIATTFSVAFISLPATANYCFSMINQTDSPIVARVFSESQNQLVLSRTLTSQKDGPNSSSASYCPIVPSPSNKFTIGFSSGNQLIRCYNTQNYSYEFTAFYGPVNFYLKYNDQEKSWSCVTEFVQ